MSTNNNAVDALQRERIKGENRRKKAPKTQPDWTPNKRTQKKIEQMLKK